MALRADGSGDYAIRTSGGFASTAGYTVAFWFKLLTDRNTSVCAWMQYATSGDAYWTYYNPSGDGTTLAWEWHGGTQAGSIAVSLDTWYFVACTRAGTGASQFISYRRTVSDTTLTTNSATAADADFTPTEEDVLSNHFNLSGAWFPGHIAALKQWSAVLTEAELLNESVQFMPFRTANLHSWRPFGDNAVSDLMVDYSGSGRTLTANGSLLVADGPPIPWRQAQRQLIIPTGAVTPPTVGPKDVIGCGIIPVVR